MSIPFHFRFLETKVRTSLKKGKLFEKRYKDIANMFPTKLTTKKADGPGEATIKSLNEVIRELQKEKHSTDANRIAKSGKSFENLLICVSSCLFVSFVIDLSHLTV